MTGKGDGDFFEFVKDDGLVSIRRFISPAKDESRFLGSGVRWWDRTPRFPCFHFSDEHLKKSGASRIKGQSGCCGLCRLCSGNGLEGEQEN
jgi:hypothetical protein